MDFYLTTSASTFPCFQINWLTSSCIKPVENLQPTCYHQAGASDVKAFWYRLDDCKATILQQTSVFLSVFDGNSAISLLWFYYDLGEIPSCFWQTSCWARKDCWRHREVADGNWTSKVKKPEHHLPIAVDPYSVTRPANFLCERKPEYPRKTCDNRQSVALHGCMYMCYNHRQICWDTREKTQNFWKVFTCPYKTAPSLHNNVDKNWNHYGDYCDTYCNNIVSGSGEYDYVSI